MSEFIHCCNKLSMLDEPARNELADSLRMKHYQKGAQLLKDREVCRYLYFIEEGLTKTYFNTDGKEFIMRFFPEGSLFTVLDSFLKASPSDYMIEALEPTTVSYISLEALEMLSARHHSIETFFRKLLAMASIHMMKRISEILEENATQRYQHFVAENGALLQRISLGDLAAYLGITQVSLSRIRAKR